MDQEDPGRSAIPAAREAIRRCNELLAGRQSFTLETTLAGHGALNTLRQAKSLGYQTLVVYVSLNSPEMNIERVRLRVSRGGHHVPDVDVRRRYERSLLHAPQALSIADEGAVFDNSDTEVVRMLSFAVRAHYLAGRRPPRLGPAIS